MVSFLSPALERLFCCCQLYSFFLSSSFFLVKYCNDGLQDDIVWAEWELYLCTYNAHKKKPIPIIARIISVDHTSVLLYHWLRSTSPTVSINLKYALLNANDMYGMFVILCVQSAAVCIGCCCMCGMAWNILDGVPLSYSLSLSLHFVAIAETTCMCIEARFRSCFYAHLMCRRCIIFNWSNINFPSNERDILYMVMMMVAVVLVTVMVVAAMVVFREKPYHSFTIRFFLQFFFLPSLFRFYSFSFEFQSGFFRFFFLPLVRLSHSLLLRYTHTRMHIYIHIHISNSGLARDSSFFLYFSCVA